MKFVILSTKKIPGFDVCGPVLTPAEYDIHQVLRWVAIGVDVREVMEDGSYRKLKFNDERLLSKLNEKLNKKIEKRNKDNAARAEVVEEVKPQGNVKMARPEKPFKKNVVKKQEPKKEEVKEEVLEPKKMVDLIIDDLEKPE